MKKVIALLIMTGLVLLSLTGCSSGKSEEQLKEELKAQLKAEMAQENNKSTAQSGQKAAPKDVKDKNELYEFVYQSISKISRDDFNQCEILYADVTGDGVDEAVVVSPNVTWLENVEIISGESGQYQRIHSEIPLAKYTTLATFEDGFLAVVGTTGGSGEHYAVMDLYAYDGAEMVNVLEGLCIEHTAAFPTADYVEEGEIDGKLTDFIYTLTKHDNRTGQDSITQKTQYTYNPNTMTFDEQPVTGKTGQGSSTQTTSPAGKVQLSQLKNGDSIGEGFIIKNLSYRQGGEKASFTLTGTAVLEGELFYEDYYQSYIFDATNGVTTILIEFPDNYIHEYMPGQSLGFKNLETLIQNLYDSDLKKIKNGQPKSLRIRVKDIEYSAKYQSEWGSSCVFVSIEN